MYGLLFLSVVLFSSNAESNLELTRKLDTLHVFPGVIETNSWKNSDALSMQDVSDDGLYQAFNKNNSAYIGKTPITPPPVLPTEDINTNTESETQNEAVVPDEILPADTDDINVSEVEIIPEVTPDTEAPQPEESTQVEPEPVSFGNVTQGIFAFFNKVTTKLPFASEIVTTEITTEDADTSTTQAESESETITTESDVFDVPATTNGEVVPAEVSEVIETITEMVVEEEIKTAFEYPITLSDFALPELASGQFITNVQLRISLAAQYEVDSEAPLPALDVEYKSDGEWMNAGSVIMESEISNALNGGYFLFALPVLEDVTSLQNLEVRLVYRGDTKNLTGIYLDSAWLEIATETFDRTILQERLLPEQLTYLKLPLVHELLSNELDFARTEDPAFVLRYESQRNAAIRFLRSIFSGTLATIQSVEFVRKDAGVIDVVPQIDMTADGLWTIQLSPEDREKLQPGTYTIELTIDEGGKIFTDAFDFQWGMLAINPDQTEYEIGDSVTIALGALSPNGNTICDANLELYIIDPLEFISRVPVTPSGLCNGNNVIDRPDYRAQFLPDVAGTYEMYVERLGADGEVLSHTSDTFVVQESHTISINRNGPTRIYPPALYPMQITVTTKTPFSGKLVERVPSDFVVKETDAQINRVGDIYELTWNFELAQNASKTFSYSFDAPDISPFLYTLGPAELVHGEDSVVVSERVPETPEILLAETLTTPLEEVGEIPVADEPAADAGNTNVAEPTTETITPEPTPEIISEPALESTQPEIIESIPEETPIVSEVPIEIPSELPTEVIEEFAPTASTSIPATTESPVSTPASPTVFVEHRQWQIASDATGSMIVFWTNASTIPSGWTCISCAATSTFWRRFPLGGASYGTTGGIATTTHTADGSVNATTDTATSESGGTTGASQQSHSHDSLTLAVASTTTLPAYRQLRVIQNNSAGDPGTIPAGAVLIFDGTLPSGWAQYAPLDGRYPMGQNTIVSSSTNTHIHSITGTTSAAAGTAVRNRTGGTQASPLPAPEGHIHTLGTTTATAAVNHEPPYIEVIFATSSVATNTPVNAIAMWSDTPPAGWLNRSSQEGDPFYNRYVKGATSYGTVGGAETHTHASMSATTSSSTANTTGRTGATGIRSTHKHTVDLSNFSTASNTPPYITVIYAKYYGLIPIYNQFAYRWYANATSTTPTDPWPVGLENIDENLPIDSSFTAVKNGDIVRLRLQLSVSNSSSTNEIFKLQFATTSSVCTAITTWNDVGNFASSTAWIGYNNAGLSDGATLSSTTITGSDIFGSYEEENPSVTMPNEVGIGLDGEWDFVIKQNDAEAGTNYCFRMVESDGTELFAYTEYPMLVTNELPQPPTLTKLFDNEKTPTTTPKFEFTTTDSESNDLTYQIQIDDDRTFGSVNVDKNTVSNGSQFTNLNTPSDKDPYTNGETIQFSLTSGLTNGTTYYWRVRAQDPTGSNAWGSWSTINSFTIDTGVTESTWFQTTEEQFDTDTLDRTDAIVTDLVQLATGSTTGTTTSTQIDFLDGSVGNAWGSLSWTDTETSSDLKYRLQYYDETSADWTFIPDADLSGNSTGFDTAPISLLSVDVETYRIIRLVGVFTNAGASPTLSDWTISWGYRIETPTLNAPFPNEKVGTTTPTFEFTTSDPQGDDLVYEIQWSTTSAFTASTTRVSSTSVGFINITNGGDLTPFTSGHTIQFTIQSADSLVNGRTYWWRVRAIDPNGSSQYSFYTDVESFTVDTAVTVSTWFQTTVEQFTTDVLSGMTNISTTSVTVASTSVETLIAYAEGTITTPRYRTWNGTTWSTEADALDVGAAITWTVTRAAPADNEYILGTMGTDGDVNMQVYASGSWDHLQEVTTAIPNTSMRGFDVAYEQTSGDAMVVTCDGDADPTYYLWNGSTWTNYGAIGLTGGNTCGWIKLISDPVSDEIIAVTRDTSGITYEARVWSGSAWGNSATWGSMNQVNHEGIAAAYEDSGNQAIVAVSNGTAQSFTWRQWNGTTWVGAAAVVTIGDDFEAGTLAADEGTDNLILCYVDQDRDIGVMRWDGSAWVTPTTELYTTWNNTVATIYDDRPVDCAFEVGGSRDGYIMVNYATTTGMAYQAWNGAAWSTAARVSTFGPSPRIQSRRTNDNLIQIASYASTTDRYDYAYWNGTTWSALQTLETDGAAGATPYKEPLMIAPKNPVTTGTVVGDPGIDFYAGSGPYWQQMSWTDTESGGSSILYQVEYYDGNSWELVPDGLITGNAAGITTSPIDLTSVLPVSTYNMLRPVANMSCNAGTCPVLQDWTITWSAGITISGSAQQFDQSSNVTSGTVGVAVNGVLQTGKTGTIAGGTWSIANVNAAPGDIVTVFASGANDANEAVAVARYDGVGNMSGLRLYEQHLALGSDDATTTPFTNANIGLYDYTNDEDLFFNATGTDLSLCVDTGCANAELYIMASSTFTPGDTLTLPSIENNGTLNLGANTVYVSRSWDNNATTTMGTSHVVFTATSTTESIDERGALSPSFYNLTFGTTTGAATWNLLSPLDVNNNLTVTRGTLARGTTSITVAGSLSNAANGVWTGMGTTTFDGSGTSYWTDSNSTLQNIGRVVIDGTSKTIQLASNALAQSILIGADDIFDVSATPFNITVMLDWINNNTFISRTGTVYFAATTTNQTITAGSDAFYNLNFTGAGGAWSFTEANLSIANNLTIATGTVTMPTGTTTLSGSFSSAGGTFAHNNATILMNASGAKTITASGTPFTNAFYNLRFTGSGSWSFVDTNATTSNDFTITQGSVTMPSDTLTVGGNFANSAGTFAHNTGTIKFTSATAKTIDTNASFYNLLFTGSGSWSFVDSSVTTLNNLTVSAGTLTLPSNTLTLGGSLTNTATLSHNSGTVLLSATAAGKTISTGASSLYNMTFNSATGGWTLTGSATTTNNFTLTSSSAFTLTSGATLAVGGVFTNSVGGASTTWTGSTLSLEAGSYALNTKTNTGDSYDTLRVKANTDIKMWNSSSTLYVVDTTGSLYSQDHSGVDGDLYIFGSYERTTGNEYWSYATDFDGTALGGSSRQVDVRFESGASALFGTSTLNIVATSTATTTIANQGSGTYTVSVINGTTTASHYDFSNLGISGLSLLGTTKVTSLSDGRFVPGVALGAGLTVSSTTIDFNPQFQIYRVDFSTTTAIAATNTAQIGGVPTSYWWFRESLGNIDGEAFDNDTGDPGSIRWDDSSLTITVSGTVFNTDEVTPLGAPACGVGGTPVRIYVEGGAIYDGACDGSGAFSISGVVITGDPTLTVFLNGAGGGTQAVTITKTPTADITNLDLIVNRVIVRHEDVDALTIADMASYDSGDDSDITFTAATGTTPLLTVFANNELHVWATSTFTPGGTVTIMSGGTGNTFDGSLHIDNAAIFTGAGTTTYSIGGIFAQDTGASFVPASSTVLMTATTSGKAITAASGETISMNELQFTGIGGSWNLNGNISATANINLATGTLTGTGNITLTNGSIYGNGLLSLGTGTTTVERTNTLGGTQAWTFANLVLGNGSVVGTTTPGSTATTTILGKLTIATAHYLDAGSSVFDFQGAGNVFVENGTFLEDTSIVQYSGTAGSNILSTNYYDLRVNALGSSPTFTGTGLGILVLGNLSVGGTSTTTLTFATSDPALDVNGDVSIAPNGTLIGSDTAVFTVGGSWDNNGTFTGSGGTVTFDNGGTKTIAAGNSSFSNVIINGAAGTFTISEHATATTAFTLTNATSFTVGSGVSLAVGGTFTNSLGGANTIWTGSTLHLFGAGNYTINVSSVSDTYEILSVASNTDIRMWNSSAVATAVDGTGSLYSQDHAGTNGALSIYGAYEKTSGTDFWNYATDFDGTSLSGGSERKVTVSFASSSSAVYTGGGLSVIGAATASTTLQNQGSGTYTLRIGGSASTSMSYYEVRNTSTDGITFSGTPNVVTLSYGDFLVSQPSGSAITVGGTVINQNPARTFTNNYFATSTGVSAFNVTATGTSVSSWRFTNHSGSIDGEFYDVDPAGDPGYLVWDDGSTTRSISGRVYSDEGTSVSTVCDGATPSIHLRIAGLTSYTTSCSGDGLGGGTGAYAFTGITFSPGDSLIVYIDGEAEKAAAVSEDLISSVSDMDLYENRVIVRHEDTDPLSIADMAFWDSSDDADIPFTAVDAGTDTLTLPANRKLIVWTNKTFRPSGNVTLSGGGGGAAYDGTLELYTNATFDATGSETHSIGGSLVSGTGASIDDETSTFTFTTTGASRTIDTNEYALYNMTMNGSGSWTVTNNALDVPNDFTFTQGTLTLPTGTTTIGGSFSNTGGTFAQNGGHMRFTSSAAETIRQGGSNFGTTTFAGSGSWTYQDTNATTTGDFLVLSGTVTAASGTLSIGGRFTNSGTFTHNSGVLRMISGAASTTVTAGGSDLYAITFAGAGSYIFTDTNVALQGTLTIAQGTVTFASGTMSIAGSLLNTGGSFNHASGTILFNSSDTGESINPGNSSFNIVSIAAPTGGYTLTGSATTTGNFSLTNAAVFTVPVGISLNVEGVFTNLVGGSNTTWTGSTLRIESGVPYTVNSSTQGGDEYNRLLITGDTDLRMWNSIATTTLDDSLSSLYSQDHASVNGELNIYGNYERTTGTDYWSYATDFDGTSIAGSPRVVTVRIANGATSTFSGGALQIIGTSAATTTITNQTTGTYSMNVTGGTLYALNYAFRNMDQNGLSLSGNTTITSIANGDFELAVNGGSLITVSSTTVNYNASQVIPGMRFATTTAITGINVSLQGTTPSAWTFTSHRGNLDGEAFDVDGATACGSIRWDDSSCLLTEQSAYRFRNDDGGEGIPDSEWYDANWSKRKRVTVTNYDATTYTDAVVKVLVTHDGDMQSDFDDLRFTDSSGTTTLSYFRETYVANTSAVVWVKVPTLAASGDTDIYMYYGNGGVSDGSNGNTTFIAFDDFEDGSLAEYSGDTSEFTVTSGGNVYERTYSQKASDPNNGQTASGGMYNNSATTTVSQGETIRFLQYIDTAGGSGDEVCTEFGVQNQTQNYAVCLELYGVDRMSLSQDVIDNDLSGTVLGSTTVTYVTGWYEVEVDWDSTDDSIFVTLYKDGAMVATTSAIDSTYTGGGIGFALWFYHGAWDVYSSRPLLATEPTTTLGFEQVSGGASWASALNTKASGVPAGTVIRPRFVVENTGFAVTDQYRLMFASKGVSPSCESVGAGSYTAVPPQSSCTGSALCMVTSSQFLNQASTTDVLGGEGTFTYGQIIEDPENTTESITAGSNEYTEVEYAITPTIDATDTSYCLRVSDAGTSLDSYVRVAELELLFEPNITSVSLNAGADIILLPGVTTTITATGTASDSNGYTDLDINGVTTTIYRSGVTDACSQDNNNCYISNGPSKCSFTNCSVVTNSCDISCWADFYYHADPTDDFSPYDGETWRATLSVSDMGGSIATGSAPSIDLTTMRAISVDDSISYPPLEVNADTGSTNPTTTVRNIGNIALDLSLEGSDLTDGGSSYIPVNYQKFATSSFTYSGCGILTCKQLSSTTPASVEVDLLKPTSTSTSVLDDVYWGIGIPFGVAGTVHHGTNLFTPVPD